MPNGADRNVVRLLRTCAVYRERYRAWPTSLHAPAAVLEDLERQLAPHAYRHLCRVLHVDKDSDIYLMAVSGDEGFLDYEETGDLGNEGIAKLTQGWLLPESHL